MKKTRIVIAGGVFAGLYAAKYLDKTLDLLFGRDIEQMITLRDMEEVSEQWTRIRAARKLVRPPGSVEMKTDIVVSEEKVG